MDGEKSLLNLCCPDVAADLLPVIAMTRQSTVVFLVVIFTHVIFGTKIYTA